MILSCCGVSARWDTTGGQTGDVLVSHPYLAPAPPRAFAHRGWHLDDLADMENSLSAFRRAAAEGYTYVETDVHSTSDDVVVIQHDPLLDRTTDGTGPIVRQTWQQVRQAQVGGREPVARLEDALEELPHTAFNIDVKSDAALEPLVQTIKAAGALDRVAVASFSEGRLARARRLAGPKLVTALGPRSAAALWASRRISLLRRTGLVNGTLAQVPVWLGRHRVVDTRLIHAATTAGIEVHTWTIDDPRRMHRLLDLGVNGIVTDRPDLLRDVLIERGEWGQRDPFG